jgi:hypothetical protein
VAIDEKKADKYIADLRKKFAEDPQKLEPFERRLIGRYEDAVVQAQQADQDVRNLRQQIDQAHARIGSLEVQFADLQGKGAAYLEALVARKFENDFDDDEITPAKKPPVVKKAVNRATKRANKKASKKKAKKASKKIRSKTNSKSAPAP